VFIALYLGQYSLFTPSATVLRSRYATPVRSLQTGLARRSPSSTAAATSLPPATESVPEKAVLPEIQSDEHKVSIRWQDAKPVCNDRTGVAYRLRKTVADGVSRANLGTRPRDCRARAVTEVMLVMVVCFKLVRGRGAPASSVIRLESRGTVVLTQACMQI
jgi:hypothetical protein